MITEPTVIGKLVTLSCGNIIIAPVNPLVITRADFDWWQSKGKYSYHNDLNDDNCPHCGSYEGNYIECPECGHGQ